MGELTTVVDTSVLTAAGIGELRMQGGWAISAVAVGELEAGVLLAEDPAAGGACGG